MAATGRSLAAVFLLAATLAAQKRGTFRASVRFAVALAAQACPPFLPLVLLCGATVFAQQPNKVIYRQVTHVATALTAGNAADAMTTFDKRFRDYDRLHDYFSALTNAYQLVNEIEVTGEQIADSEATLTVHWVMTLSDSQTRSDDVTVKLNLRESKWRIVDFSPIEFFNPQLQKSK